MEGPIPYLCTYYAHPLVVFRGEEDGNNTPWIPICEFMLHAKELIHLAINWLQKLKMLRCYQEKS